MIIIANFDHTNDFVLFLIDQDSIPLFVPGEYVFRLYELVKSGIAFLRILIADTFIKN